VTVFSPYVVLNRTGLELDVRAEGAKLFGTSSAAAGQVALADSNADGRKVVPFMFSYPGDGKKNRARLKIDDSEWSKPQSFDAIGSTYSVQLNSGIRRDTMTLGVSIVEGEGKVSNSLRSGLG
jgi:vacuolar protein sorting-associated protein 13A/C